MNRLSASFAAFLCLAVLLTEGCKSPCDWAPYDDGRIVLGGQSVPTAFAGLDVDPSVGFVSQCAARELQSSTNFETQVVGPDGRGLPHQVEVRDTGYWVGSEEPAAGVSVVAKFTPESPGEYRVTAKVDGAEVSKTVVVQKDFRQLSTETLPRYCSDLESLGDTTWKCDNAVIDSAGNVLYSGGPRRLLGFRGGFWSVDNASIQHWSLSATGSVQLDGESQDPSVSPSSFAVGMPAQLYIEEASQIAAFEFDGGIRPLGSVADVGSEGTIRSFAVVDGSILLVVDTPTGGQSVCVLEKDHFASRSCNSVAHESRVEIDRHGVWLLDENAVRFMGGGTDVSLTLPFDVRKAFSETNDSRPSAPLNDRIDRTTILGIEDGRIVLESYRTSYEQTDISGKALADSDLFWTVSEAPSPRTFVVRRPR